MSFLICGCGEGALRTTVRRCGWRRLSKRLQQQEQRAGAGVTKSKKRNSRPITPFKLYKPTCLPRQYSTAAQVIGFQKRSVRVKGSEDDKEQKKNYIYPDVGNFFSHSIVSSVHIWDFYVCHKSVVSYTFTQAMVCLHLSLKLLIEKYTKNIKTGRGVQTVENTGCKAANYDGCERVHCGHAANKICKAQKQPASVADNRTGVGHQRGNWQPHCVGAEQHAGPGTGPLCFLQLEFRHLLVPLLILHTVHHNGISLLEHIQDIIYMHTLRYIVYNVPTNWVPILLRLSAASGELIVLLDCHPSDRLIRRIALYINRSRITLWFPRFKNY
ncbi:hypothetical protein QTP88_014820 [Uroleucon formosanum]